MLEGLLSEDNCKKCKLCCHFEEDELIDAPTFTNEEKRYIINNIDGNIMFNAINKVYQIVLEKEGKLYRCPLLRNDGCVLKDKRPFDCKSWPLYIMREDDKYYITVSKDCPILKEIETSKLVEYIEKEFLFIAKQIIKDTPDMITEYNRNLEILYKITE